MRYLMSILAAVSLLGATVGSVPAAAQAKRHATTKKAAVKYECPMRHYASNKPGKCPKCGMNLVAVKPHSNAAHTKAHHHSGATAAHHHSDHHHDH